MAIGVRRVKKFIRFWDLYRSRTAFMSVFRLILRCAGETADGEVDEVDDVAEVREGVRERR